MESQTGTRIREARTAAGMTQAELAKAVEGVSVSGIGKAERGEKALTPEQLKAVADATGVTIEFLMNEAEDSYAEKEKASLTWQRKLRQMRHRG